MLMSAIIGHQGVRGLLSGDWIGVIQAAEALGLRWVQLDVVLTEARGVVQVAGHQEPVQLSRALNEIQAVGLGVNLRIKTTESLQVKKAISALAEELLYFPGLPVVIASSDLDLLAEARQLLPGLPRACVWEHLPKAWLTQAKDLEVHAIYLAGEGLAPHPIQWIKSLGKEVYVYTVNSVTQAKQLFAWGIKGIITDQPDVFLPHLTQSSGPPPFGDPL